ncbi:hypothetical protein PHMEG_0008946 [Phytophthora megakarya]|uniref:Uncharacterized protein n=1 Tax=Phytophthora megakarya TaxID=4795 RepID=A0A225WHD8_9STRA|nr:hypothetical protein PHMEG_0008946 [Phytophthora megakarya]
MDGRLVEMLRFYASHHWGPNVRGRTTFKRRPDAEIKLVKSCEASLNAQISGMNAVIKRHQEMYDRLENRMQLTHRSNAILTKEVNYGRSEYLEITVTLKLCERNRDLVRRVKRLEKATRLSVRDFGLKTCFEFDKIDWETLAPASQTRRALQAVYKHGRDRESLADDIARAKCFHNLKFSSEHPAVFGGSFCAIAVFFTVALHHADWASSRRHYRRTHFKFCAVFGYTCWPGKGKAKRQRTGSDDETVDFAGRDSGEDAPEESRECSATSSSTPTSQPLPKKQKASPPTTHPAPAKKSRPSPKSSSSKPSTPTAARGKTVSASKKIDAAAESMSSRRLTPKRKAAMSSEFRSSFRLAGGSRSDIKSLTSESPAGQSVNPPSSDSNKTRPKKTGTNAKPGYSSSDESVVSVSSESESESSLDLDSSASEGSEAHVDEDGELSKLRPESQCLEVQLQAKHLSTTKAAFKSSPKGKKKASPKSAGKKKLSAKTRNVTASKKKFKSAPRLLDPPRRRKLVNLAQRASTLLTPYVAPEFTSLNAQKYWVKLEQSFLFSPLPSDAEIKCTTVGIEKFCKFMAPDHPWQKTMDKWPEHACLFDAIDLQLDSHISQRADYLERLCKHWDSPEAVKRFFSRMTARLETNKDPEEHRKFKLALDRLKKVWFTYNKERVDRAGNLRTFLPGRMWPWFVGLDASLPIETLLDPTLSFYTIENLMWVPGSADWCVEAALPEDIDSSWDRAFRGADEDEEMEEDEVGEDDADSVAIMDLNQDSTGDTSTVPQDAAAEATLILL